MSQTPPSPIRGCLVFTGKIQVILGMTAVPSKCGSFLGIGPRKITAITVVAPTTTVIVSFHSPSGMRYAYLHLSQAGLT